MDTTTNLTTQVQEDYMSYAMSVLIGRSIPSLTDGMKPVHRRIMTAMKWLSLKPDGRYMKSARVEGEVMGKLHPHGSSYGAMVTLAAPWSNNIPLIDGQGNWGSSTDNPASSRYTESKLTAFSWDALLDDSDIWETIPNYDGTLQEPVELNVKVPAVLLNGQDGIGVGFATKIPPHSLRDVCDAVTKGTVLTPSFPTGCDIVNDSGLTDYQKTGAGSIRCRARVELGSQTRNRGKDRATLSFTNLPPGCNPEKLGEQIKNELEKGRLENIVEVTDDSDRTGDRVTVVAKPGADITLVQRQLYAYTDLDTKFSARTLVIDNLRPCELSPVEVVSRWKTWRLAVLERKFSYELDAKEHRHEVVTGLIKAIDKIDLVIKTIRAAASPKEALIELVSNRSLKFTADQAKAILEMRLRSLTNLDSDELADERTQLETRITALTELIASETARTKYMLAEVKAIGTRHGETRRSAIIDPPESLTVAKGSTRVAAPTAKPRFIKIDMKKGIIEVAKGPRGAMVLDPGDKIITVTSDGTLKKLPANFKGVLGATYSEVKLAKKETEVTNRKYLLVFILGDQLKAVALSGTDLCRTTSKGKSVLPETARMVYFGEGSYSVPWVSDRKKKVELFPVTTKEGKPGAKGVKVAQLDEIHHPTASFTA